MKTTTSNRILRGLALAASASVVLLAGCATGPNANPADPIEPFNREVFRINDDFDKGVLKPVAQTYVDVVPSPARTAVSNFFSNAGDVYSAVNNLLQLKGTAALEDTMRVAINTVLGLGGLRKTSARPWACGACRPVRTSCGRCWARARCAIPPASWSTGSWIRSRIGTTARSRTRWPRCAWWMCAPACWA
jgi:hypothetical protein